MPHTSELTLHCTRSFASIRKDWERLYHQTPEVSPFLAPDAFRISLRYFFPYYIIGRSLPLFCLFRRGNETIAIAPLIKNLKGKVSLFGNVNGFNECGILFSDKEDLPECIRLLRSRFGTVRIARIDERSALSQFKGVTFQSTNNVAIHFGESFDPYFSALSSSVRQNIRTAYNRLSKDGHTQNLYVVNQGGHRQMFRHIVDLYIKRHSDRYGVTTSPLKAWYLKHLSFATRFYRNAPNALTFYLTIDNQPAAFMSGLFSADRLIVPRLSINSEFRRYSPGLILICESIKHLMANTPIRILDLSQGEENYKYQLGGIKHLSYSFNL